MFSVSCGELTVASSLVADRPSLLITNRVPLGVTRGRSAARAECHVPESLQESLSLW